jgi:hypothetical protein
MGLGSQRAPLAAVGDRWPTHIHAASTFVVLAALVSAGTHFGLAADTPTRRLLMFGAHGISMASFLGLWLQGVRYQRHAWRSMRGRAPQWDPFALRRTPSVPLGRIVASIAVAVYFVVAVEGTAGTPPRSPAELREAAAGWLLVAVLYVCWAPVVERATARAVRDAQESAR